MTVQPNHFHSNGEHLSILLEMHASLSMFFFSVFVFVLSMQVKQAVKHIDIDAVQT